MRPLVQQEVLVEQQEVVGKSWRQRQVKVLMQRQAGRGCGSGSGSAFEPERLMNLSVSLQNLTWEPQLGALQTAEQQGSVQQLERNCDWHVGSFWLGVPLPRVREGGGLPSQGVGERRGWV